MGQSGRSGRDACGDSEADGYVPGEIYIIYTDFKPYKYPSAEEMRAEGQYIITFHTAGGKYVDSLLVDGGNTLAAVTVDWNTAPELPTPEKTGYNFVGWFLSDGTKYEGAPVTADITLTAHWEVKTFTVIFYVNGEVYKTVTVEYGARLGRVADVAKVYANNIVSFSNINSDTPAVAAADFTISDDMIIVANEPSTFEKVLKSNYMPYVIGGIVLIIALGVIVFVVETKKKKNNDKDAKQ